jgi:tetratricopeptide (TPR) repeat protein
MSSISHTLPRTVSPVRPLIVSALAIAALALLSPARAADLTPPAAPAAAAPADPLASARGLIGQQRWADAITELKRINLAGNADWNNLMGYSHRKAKTPDLAAAERYYDAALRLDPRHRGALEYSGELFLQKGEPARAEARLATLTQVCGQCEEQAQRQRAIAAYRSGAPLPARTEAGYNPGR